MKLSAAFILTVAGALTGCGGMVARHQEVRNDMQRDFAETIPTCISEKECQVKWSAARRFVTAHSDWKIQTLTTDFLETYNPRSGDPGLAWSVSKDAASDGMSYRIVARARCANMFGCVPDAMKTMIAFNREVSAAWKPGP